MLLSTLFSRSPPGAAKLLSVTALLGIWTSKGSTQDSLNMTSCDKTNLED